MKWILIFLVVAAGCAAAFIALRAEKPTYTAPVSVKTALASTPASGEVVREFAIEGMCCGSCAPKVYAALAAAPGVREAAVDFETATARAIVPSDADVAALEKAMTFDDYVATARP